MKTLNIKNRNYTIVSQEEAGLSAQAKIGVVFHFVLKMGKTLFIADQFTSGQFRVNKASRSLLSII